MWYSCMCEMCSHLCRYIYMYVHICMDDTLCIGPRACQCVESSWLACSRDLPALLPMFRDYRCPPSIAMGVGGPDSALHAVQQALLPTEPSSQLVLGAFFSHIMPWH